MVRIQGVYCSADINSEIPGIAKLLAARCQVVASDVRGHGRPGKSGQDNGVLRQADAGPIPLVAGAEPSWRTAASVVDRGSLQARS